MLRGGGRLVVQLAWSLGLLAFVFPPFIGAFFDDAFPEFDEGGFHLGGLFRHFLREVVFLLPVFGDVEEPEVGEGFVSHDFPVADAHRDALIVVGNVSAPEERDFACGDFSFERGEHVDAVDGAVFGDFDADDVENGGEDIGSDDGDLTGGARLDVLRSGYDAGDANAAFVVAALMTAEAATGAAVVGHRAVV